MTKYSTGDGERHFGDRFVKPAAALLAALLLQFTEAAAPPPTAEPQHFPYQRVLHVGPRSSGQACAVLDAAVFAHAASESLNDARLYADSTREMPFTLSENATTATEPAGAPARNIAMRGQDLAFDLEMPHRAYTAVDLKIAAHDFLAVATVSARKTSGAPLVNLGSFAVFDFSAQKLARSTTLFLQESTYPELHVVLHPVATGNEQPHILATAVVQGATVPPSREAQTLYTTVAEAPIVTQRGGESVATLRLPAHVPVERVLFLLAPGFTGSFLRRVTLTAHPDHAQDSAAVETVSGEISAVSNIKLPAELSGANTVVQFHKLALDAALGANLRQGATVDIAVENGKDAPLPITAVRLEMRQRRICFDTSSGATEYTLMYGDASLPAPVYHQYAHSFVAAANPAASTLSPQQTNPAYRARKDARTYVQRHPELFWVVLLGALAMLGTMVRHRAARLR